MDKSPFDEYALQRMCLHDRKYMLCTWGMFINAWIMALWACLGIVVVGFTWQSALGISIFVFTQLDFMRVPKL